MPATIPELYESLIENFLELACDVCVIEALYRSRATLSQFETAPALDIEISRAKEYLEQHSKDTESSGRWLLERLSAEADAKKEPS